MYRTSQDLRFIKNKEAMQRAFIDLALEQGLEDISVTQLAQKARVNRMTFYAHYDVMSDIVSEFTDDMLYEVLETVDKKESFDIEEFLQVTTALMNKELRFFQLIAKNERYAYCRNQFRAAFEKILEKELEKVGLKQSSHRQITGDMLASSITYAYLDWLAGKYGDLPLETVINSFKDLLNSVVSVTRVRDADNSDNPQNCSSPS